MNCMEKNSDEKVKVSVSVEPALIIKSAPGLNVEVDMEEGNAVPVQITSPPRKI
jgi:hypothetical protein